MQLFQCITSKITVSANKKPGLRAYWFVTLLFRAVPAKIIKAYNEDTITASSNCSLQNNPFILKIFYQHSLTEPCKKI